MASSRGGGTAAAAEQLGSMSLGDSAERKDNGTGSTAKSGTTPTKLLCSACGKKSDALMKCRACKCVWYCDKDCQNKHWKEHKKECRPIKQILDNRGGKLDVGTEKDLGPLPDLPPREECPICMRMLPFHDSLRMYKTCCGKNLCVACHFQHQMKRSEQAVASTCAFCREPMSVSDDNERSLQGIDLGVKRQPDEEVLVRLSKRVELKDPDALLCMALAHGRGELGLPVDQGKCIELLRESAGLGLSGALYQLGQCYQNGKMGLEQNKEKGQKYLEKAAEGGHLTSKHNLGCGEWETGDRVAAIRHWQLAAAGGFKNSLNNVILSFQEGLLHHGDLSKALQAFYLARAEIKSDDRDKYIAYLKLKGEYKEEHDL